MRKRFMGAALAAVCIAVLAVSGCGENINELKENAKAKALSEPAKTVEEETEEEEKQASGEQLYPEDFEEDEE